MSLASSRQSFENSLFLTVLVDSLNPIVLSDHESDSGDTTVSGDLHTAPQVCGPALEGVLDPNQD